MKSGIFLSYARGDDPPADVNPFSGRLYAALRKRGFAVWWDRADMPSRALSFLQEIRDAIDGHERMVVVIGPHAVKSEYVRAEWQYGLSASKVVIPVLRRGDYALLPPEFKNLQLHCPDFRARRPWKAAVDELARILSDPVPPLGKLHGVVPAPPAHFQPRPDETSRLADTVLLDIKQPVVAEPQDRVIVLHGMGGAGKSVVASAFARSTETRRAFSGDVFWLHAGRSPDVLRLLAYTAKTLKPDDDPRHYTDASGAQARLRDLLEDACCLIVLDDVWDIAHAEPFLNAIGRKCRLLITTRIMGLAPGAQEHRLEELSTESALQLLADWTGHQTGTLPAEAYEIVRECGNLPLAVAGCGAMIGPRGNRWLNVLDKLRHADLGRIRQQFPNYPYPDLLKAIQVSVDDLLEPDVQERYRGIHLRFFDLAVFREHVPIPEAAVGVLWEPAGLSEYDTQDYIDFLVNRSLLQRRSDGGLTMHDLHLDYARRQAGDLRAIECRLLEAYRGKCPAGWLSGPNDGYFFQNLVHHLEQAGRVAEIHELLALETAGRRNAWYEARSVQQDVPGFRADVIRALQLSLEGDWSAPPEAGAENLGRQIRYTLYLASIHSWFPHLPREAVAAAVEKGIWTAGQALAYAAENPRAGSLIALAAVLPESEWDALSDLGARLPGNVERMEALLGLARFSPKQKRTEVIRAALTAVRGAGLDFVDRSSLQDVVPPLIREMPAELFEEALAAIPELPSAHELLSLLLPRLPKRLLPRARKLARHPRVQDSAPRPTPLPRWLSSVGSARELLEQARAIPGTCLRAAELAKLSLVLPESLKDGAIEDAVRCACSAKPDWIRAMALRDVEPFCEGEHLRAIAKQAVSLDISDRRVGSYLRDMGSIKQADGGRFVEASSEAPAPFPRPLGRFVALHEMALWLPRTLRDRAIKAGIAAMGHFNAWRMTRALDLLVISPWKESVPGLSKVVMELDGDARATLAGVMKPSLSTDRWQDYVQTILDDKRLSADSVIALLPHLEGRLLDSALRRGVELCRRTADATKLLAALAPLLPADLLAEALRLRTVGDGKSLARLGLALACFLPEEFAGQGLDLIPQAELDDPDIPKWRNKILGELLKALPAHLGRRILDAVLAFDFAKQRIEVLQSIAPAAPPEYRPAISAGILKAWDENEYRTKYDLKPMLACMLPGDIEKLLAAFLTKETPIGDSEDVVCMAGPKLPEDTRARVFQQVVDAADAAGGGDLGLFLRLFMVFPEPEKSTAFERAWKELEEHLSSPGDSERLSDLRHALKQLAPRFSAAQAERVLAWLASLPEHAEFREIHDDNFADVLVSIFPRLPDEAKARATGMAFSIETATTRASAGVKLASLVREDERAAFSRKVVEVLLALPTTYEEETAVMYRGLAILAPSLDASDVQKLLQQARSAPGEPSNGVLLAALAPTLPEPDAQDITLLRKAWKSSKYWWERQALINLVSRTPEPRQSELWVELSPFNVVDFAYLVPSMSDESRAAHVDGALTWLEQKKDYLEVHEYEREDGSADLLAKFAAAASTGEQLARLFRLAMRLKPGRDRTRVLEVVAAQLAKLPPEMLFPAWETVLGQLPGLDRPELLEVVLPLSPVFATLGGGPSTAAIFRALGDVGTWWP